MLRHGIKKVTNGPAHLFFDNLLFWILCSGASSGAPFANINEGLRVTDAQCANMLQPMMVPSQTASKRFITHIVAIDFHVMVQSRRQEGLEVFASQTSASHIAVQNKL
jgi:hypothetical protein